MVIAGVSGCPVIESAMLGLAGAQGVGRGEIAIAHPMNREGDLLRVTGKGSKGRVVPLDALTLNLLEQIEAAQGRQEFNFRVRFAGQLPPETVYKWLKRYLGDDWGSPNLLQRRPSIGHLDMGDLRRTQSLLCSATLAHLQG